MVSLDVTAGSEYIHREMPSREALKQDSCHAFLSLPLSLQPGDDFLMFSLVSRLRVRVSSIQKPTSRAWAAIIDAQYGWSHSQNSNKLYLSKVAVIVIKIVDKVESTSSILDLLTRFNQNAC